MLILLLIYWPLDVIEVSDRDCDYRLIINKFKSNYEL
jgi:hypothetical protein